MKNIDIFYADDDEDDLDFFNEVIEKIALTSGFRINLHLHKDGEKLIENIKANKNRNGVVFLDINMPCKTGFELLEEIRKEPEIKLFPVIIYTTSSSRDNIEKSQFLGANFYAVKPYRFNDLLKMISSFLQVNWKNHRTDSETFLYKN